jgi:hypothetical protein
MNKSKLTLSIDTDKVKNFKKYAIDKNTTVSALVSKTLSDLIKLDLINEQQSKHDK